MSEATWMSWCKRRGNHETKLQARLSWNEEFLEVFREVLKRSFDKFESALRAKYKRLHDTISELLDLVEDSVAGSSLPGIGEFQKLVQSQYFELERVIATEWERQIKLIA